MPAYSALVRRVLVIVAVVVGLSACTHQSAAPPVVVSTSTPTTLPPPPNASGVALPVTRGVTTTTRLAIQGGSASIGGRATDPSGAPAAGALVHLERLVGDNIATTDVAVAADGTWRAGGLRGGRYRVRGWRVPDLAMTSPDIFFLAATESHTSNLSLNRFDQLAYSFAVAPNPLIYGEAANIALRINRRVVSPAGVVGNHGESGVLVTLTPNSAVTLESAPAITTDANGQGFWSVRCVALGSGTVSVTLATGEVQVYQLPACVEPPPPTTVPPPATTVAP